MAFSPIFQRPFSATFDRRAAAAAAVPWWLAGGVAAANAIAVYQPKGAASLAASYVNLANPGTYDAAPGVAPTWAAGVGWTFNGTTQYLTTGVSLNQTYSMLVRFSGATLAALCSIAGQDGSATSRFRFGPRTTGVFYACGATTSTMAPATTSGVIGLSGYQPYRNSATDGAPTSGWVGVGIDTFIGAYNNQGVGAAQFYTGNVAALAIYNTTLTAPQVLAVSTAMAAL